MPAPTSSSFHERLVAHEAIPAPSNRRFGVFFAALFTVVALLPLIRGGSVRSWLLIVAAALLVIAVIYPRALAPLNVLWLKFGLLLHTCISPVVLGLVFFTTVTPIGVVLRMFGKDLLALRFERDVQTYWIPRQPPGPAPDSMSRQF